MTIDCEHSARLCGARSGSPQILCRLRTFVSLRLAPIIFVIMVKCLFSVSFMDYKTKLSYMTVLLTRCATKCSPHSPDRNARIQTTQLTSPLRVMLTLSFLVLAVLMFFRTANLHPLSFFILASFYCAEECFALNCDINGTSTTTSTLRLLVLLPSSLESGALHRQQHHHSWNYGRDITLPALELAVEQVNNRLNLLPCHKLELVYKETECGTTTNALFGLSSGLFPSPVARSSQCEGKSGCWCYWSCLSSLCDTDICYC